MSEAWAVPQQQRVAAAAAAVAAGARGVVVDNYSPIKRILFLTMCVIPMAHGPVNHRRNWYELFIFASLCLITKGN